MKLASLLLCLAAFVSAFAQTGRSFPSVEAYAGAGKIVYFGHIKAIEELSEVGLERKPHIYGKPYRVVFGVKETFRGAQVKEIELTLALQYTTYLNYMQDHKFEILLSAGPTHMESFPTPERGWDGATYYHFRVLSPLPQKRLEKDQILDQLGVYYDHGRIFTADLSIFTGRDKILRRVQEFVKKYPEPLHVTHLHVPNAFGELVGDPNAFCSIVLPKCKETEKMLVDLIQKPEKMIRRMKTKGGETYRDSIVENAKRALASLSKPGNIGE